MNNPQEPSNQKQKKLITLGLVGFLAVSGGIYLFSKHQGVQPQGGEDASVSGTPATVVGGVGVSNKSPATGAVARGKNSVGGPDSGIAVGTGGAVPLPGAASLPGAPSTGVATAQKSATPAAPVLDQCVTITYQHKPSAAHPDEESCSHHKNFLKMPEFDGKKIAAGSVCVRVNGTPVHYLTVKGHADELIFGSVAGPKSKVTVRYCTGLAQGCAKEDCSIPKDEFMEAIGGGDGKGQNPKLGQWDPSAPAGKAADVMAKLDSTVKRELETNDDLNGRAPAGEIYKDWIGQSETAVCGTTQAKN
jgi:hypothetical protein